jgi:hypothetical protein
MARAPIAFIQYQALMVRAKVLLPARDEQYCNLPAAEISSRTPRRATPSDLATGFHYQDHRMTNRIAALSCRSAF